MGCLAQRSSLGGTVMTFYETNRQTPLKSAHSPLFHDYLQFISDGVCGVDDVVVLVIAGV